MRGSVNDTLDGQHHTVALQIEDDGPADQLLCGPRRAKATRMLFDKEEQAPDVADVTLTTLTAARVQAAMAAYAAAHPPASAPIPPPLSNMSAAAPPPASNSSAADDDAGEEAADQSFYEQRAATAAAKRLLIRDQRGRYCCVSLGDVVTKFRSEGATAGIDTADDGTVWIEVKAPRGTWRGKTELTLEFQPVPGDDRLELASIKSGDQVLATKDGAGAASAPTFLIERFGLRPAAGDPR